MLVATSLPLVLIESIKSSLVHNVSTLATSIHHRQLPQVQRLSWNTLRVQDFSGIRWKGLLVDILLQS